MCLQNNPMLIGHPKTSYTQAKHNIGELRQKVNFQNDNLSSYEDYV